MGVWLGQGQLVYIDEVSVHPCALVAACMEDSGADVAREAIGLGG